MVVHVAILGILTFVGTALGSILGGLGISFASIAAASLLATLLGLVFGAAALALGAATGRMAITVSGTVGLAFVLCLLNSFLPLSDALEDYANLSPFHYSVVLLCSHV